MKRVLISIMLLILSGGVYAQKVDFQQSQTRILEPLQDVFIRPLVADLQIIKQERQVYGPYMDYTNSEITQITYEMLEQAKINAVYNAALTDDADIIVAATFKIQTPKQGKGIEITVRGYPAKYTNWHKVSSKSKSSDGEIIDDYEWMEKGLFRGTQIRTVTKDANEEKTEAVKGKK